MLNGSLIPRLLTCPRCQGLMVDEPGARRCVMCGRIFFDALRSAVQREFERRSGLQRGAERV